MGSLLDKLAAYFAAGVPLVAAGAALYAVASGKPFEAGVVQAFGNLYNVPGTTVLGDISTAATLVNTFSFFVGTLSFGLLLGLITQDLQIRRDPHPHPRTDQVLSGAGGQL